MITLIIGQNAIGKTVYIKNKVKNTVEDNENIIFNFFDTSYLNNRGYDKNRIEALEDVLDTDKIDIDNPEYLSIKTDEIRIGKSFNNILTIICKEGNELYLDEPEYGLNNHEIGYLVKFLYRILDTFNNIEIVTHSELFLGILDAEKKTVTMDEKKNFILTDLREDAYATID